MQWRAGASVGAASGSASGGGSPKWRPNTTATTPRGAPSKTKKRQQQFAIDRLLSTTTITGPALAKEYYKVEGDDSDSDDTATTAEALTSSSTTAVPLSSKRLRSVRPATTPMRRWVRARGKHAALIELINCRRVTRDYLRVPTHLVRVTRHEKNVLCDHRRQHDVLQSADHSIAYKRCTTLDVSRRWPYLVVLRVQYVQDTYCRL